MTTLNHRIEKKPPKAPPASEIVGIESKEDALDATIKWMGGRLFSLSNKRRVEVCQALIDGCKEYDVSPNGLWQSIIDNPEYYNEMAEDYEDD